MALYHEGDKIDTDDNDGSDSESRLKRYRFDIAVDSASVYDVVSYGY